MQNAINDHEAILLVLGHLAKTSDDIVREVLAFVATMLFGGNYAVQVAIYLCNAEYILFHNGNDF